MSPLAADLPNEATFSGSHGSLTIHKPFNCATSFTSPAGTKEYPLPEPSMPMNFPNSTGLRYVLNHMVVTIKTNQPSGLSSLVHVFLVVVTSKALDGSLELTQDSLKILYSDPIVFLEDIS